MYIFSVLTTSSTFFDKKRIMHFLHYPFFYSYCFHPGWSAQLSGDYLNRITKKYTGMTLFEYRTTFSIRKAEFILCGIHTSLFDRYLICRDTVNIYVGALVYHRKHFVDLLVRPLHLQQYGSVRLISYPASHTKMFAACSAR